MKEPQSKNEPASSSREEEFSEFIDRIRLWFRLKKLQYQRFSSRNFEKTCEEFQCSNLAEMEREYGEQIAREIESVEQRLRK